MFSCLPGAFRVSTRNDFVLKSFVNAVASSLLRERAALSQNPGTEFVERCCVRYCRQKVFKRIFVGDANKIKYLQDPQFPTRYALRYGLVCE
jgi:hypothetical protein